MQVNRRLYRCRENRVLVGVAAGVAEFFDLDPTLVRVLWFCSIFVGGLGILLYIGMALIVPLEPVGPTDGPTGPDVPGEAGATVAVDNHRHAVGEGHHHRNRGSGRVSMFIGLGLILFGGLALVDIALPDWAMSWRYLWPLLIIGLGGLLIAGAIGRERTEP
jgi:phage shock protein C